MEFDLHQKPITSDITEFIDELRKKDPTLEQRQQEGRLRLWDHPIDHQEEAEFDKANVPQTAYVYQVKGE
ncbi:hypothetical protein CUZ56_01532 [Saezia sanguinis]|jgi:hypothetical protein|uniref:Acetyl-CoA carboxyl transferase n=1 Tax=Saezia sanguinis TaxID=1965230 RepID=A0A433SDC1_9BURK|nr:DUF3460 family protein [Saezia sanguinis]RUS66741.1 hypothetical protein CUZ56_01532 [Saezia sanguinis]